MTLFGILAAHAAVTQVAMPYPGVFFAPADGQPHAGILLLHGLEGGQAQDRVREARALAEQGFAAVALCSFDCGPEWPGYPADPQVIDLSRAYEAFHWLRLTEQVARRPVALYGLGRGAEHALVLTSYLSKRSEFWSPNALILHAPVAQVTVPLWSWAGDPVPAVGSVISLDRYSGNVLGTHGMMDATVDGSLALEDQLRAKGAAVVAYEHSQDLTIPVRVSRPSGSPGAPRAAFHYYVGQGAVFDAATDAVRLESVATFLRLALGE